MLQIKKIEILQRIGGLLPLNKICRIKVRPKKKVRWLAKHSQGVKTFFWSTEFVFPTPILKKIKILFKFIKQFFEPLILFSTVQLKATFLKPWVTKTMRMDRESLYLQLPLAKRTQFVRFKVKTFF